MPVGTLEDRVTSLERRMSELEGQVGFLIPLVRQIHLDLLGFKDDVDQSFEALDRKFTQKFDHLDAKFTRKFDQLDAKVDAMPRAVAEIVTVLVAKK